MNNSIACAAAGFSISTPYAPIPFQSCIHCIFWAFQMILRQPQQSKEVLDLLPRPDLSERHTIYFRKRKETSCSSPKELLQPEEAICQTSALSSCTRTRWVPGESRNSIYKRNYKEKGGRERVRTWEDTNSKLPKNWKLEKFLSDKHPHLFRSSRSTATAEKMLRWKTRHLRRTKGRFAQVSGNVQAGLLTLMVATLSFWGHCFWKRLLLSQRSPGKYSVQFFFKETIARYMKNKLQSSREQQQKGK